MAITYLPDALEQADAIVRRFGQILITRNRTGQFVIEVSGSSARE